MEDVDRGVAVRANERLSSLKFNHCCSRHLPYSKCCLNESYVLTLRYLAYVTSAYDLHVGILRHVGNVVILKKKKEKGGHKHTYQKLLFFYAFDLMILIN